MPALYTVEAKIYELTEPFNNVSIWPGNVSEWTNSKLEPQSALIMYHRWTLMAGDLEHVEKFLEVVSWKDVAYFLQVSTRDYEYADSARS